MPCSVVLLSVGDGDSRDAMTATAMFVAENIPLLVVSVSKESTCHALIEKYGEFCLNVASKDQIDLARKLGATHGKAMDKFEAFNIEVEKASKIKSPMIAGSFANLECKVVTSHTAASYIVYMAEVTAYKTDDKRTPVAWHNDRYFALQNEIR